jgi:hypothetical protein
MLTVCDQQHCCKPAPAWVRPSRPLEAPEQRRQGRGFGRGLSNHTTVANGRASPHRSRRQEKKAVREFRRPPSLASSAGLAATFADAPRSPRRTCLLLAMTVEMREAAPNRGEKDAAKAALRVRGFPRSPRRAIAASRDDKVSGIATTRHCLRLAMTECGDSRDCHVALAGFSQ